jgi:hypothetical protein
MVLCGACAPGERTGLGPVRGLPDINFDVGVGLVRVGLDPAVDLVIDDLGDLLAEDHQQEDHTGEEDVDVVHLLDADAGDNDDAENFPRSCVCLVDLAVEICHGVSLP